MTTLLVQAGFSAILSSSFCVMIGMTVYDSDDATA